MPQPKRKLINPDDLVISSVTHESGGKVLHTEADCPADNTCAVWKVWHPSDRRAFTTMRAESPEPRLTVLERWQAEAPAWLRGAVTAYYESWPPLADLSPEAILGLSPDDGAWDEARVEDFLLFTVRSLRIETRDGAMMRYEVTETNDA